MIDLIGDHHVRTWTLIGSGAGGRLVDNDDFLLTLGAIDHVPYNHVLRCTPTRDPDAVIDDVLDVMDGHEAIWSVTSASRPDDLSQRLIARGCRLYSLITGMALDLRAWTPQPDDAGSDVEMVEAGDDLLEAWADLVLDQWHLTPDDRAALLTISRGIGFETARRWLAFVDGAAIAKATAAIYDAGVAGIYGVGTRPDGRGRGLATILMVEVLRQLQASGVHTVVLHATPAAVNIYHRLGFVEHCRIPVYTLPDSRPPTERMART